MQAFARRVEAMLKRITAARAYPAAEVRKIEDSSRLRQTASHENRVAAVAEFVRIPSRGR